jgi:hypothetical protein
MEGEQVTPFLQDLMSALKNDPRLVSRAAARRLPQPMDPDALMIFLKRSWLENGNVVRYSVEFRTVTEQNRPFTGTLLGTSTDGCLRDQLSPCMEKVIAAAIKAGQKLPKRQRDPLAQPG